MLGLAGMKEFILESNLLSSDKITAGLYFQASARGMDLNSQQAKDWISTQWQAIAGAPYRSDAFRALVYQNLQMAISIAPENRTAAQTKVIAAFQEYIKQKRTYLAQMGLAMYDAWKAYDEKAKNSVKRSSLQQMFDYGTVPLDFHGTLGSIAALGAGGIGLAGATMASVAYANQLGLAGATNAVVNSAKVLKGLEKVTEAADPLSKAVRYLSTVPINKQTAFISLVPKGDAFAGQSMSNILKPLNLFKGTAAANAALAGSTIITIAFAIIQSVAIDQFIAIQTARPKLEAALLQAQQPVDLGQVFSQPNGADLVLYYWAKAMETEFNLEDPQIKTLAQLAYQQAQSNGYQFGTGQ